MTFLKTPRLHLRNVAERDAETMFDYRNNGAEADWGNAKDSIERAIWFLTTREP